MNFFEKKADKDRLHQRRNRIKEHVLRYESLKDRGCDCGCDPITNFITEEEITEAIERVLKLES